MVINLTVNAYRSPSATVQDLEAVKTAITFLAVFSTPAINTSFSVDVAYEDLLPLTDWMPFDLEGNPLIVTYKVV